MRWFVEVNSIGKTDKQSYCVESDSWQRALQAARGLRNDDGPMTGFSIELLDDGFSAVDPMARVRYFVKRAPNEAPVSLPATTDEVPTVPRPVATGEAPVMPTARRSSAPPGPSPRATAPQAGKSSTNPKKDRAKTVGFGSTGAAVVHEPREPSREMSHPPSTVPKPSTGPSTTLSSAPPLAASAVVSSPPAGAISSPVILPGVEVLFKREQEPDSRSPLSYREYAYFFAAGSEESVAKAMLLAQFELVKESLASVPAGKLVNVAMFDIEFKGKPPVLPVVTLSWKDWKGDPVIDFPRRKRNGPSIPPPPAQEPAPSVPPITDAAAPAVAPTFPLPRRSTTPTGSPIAPLAPAVASVPAPPSAVAPQPSPVSHSTRPSAGVVPAAALAASIPQTAPPPPPQSVARLTPTHGVRRAGSKPGLQGRLRGDELITDLFEAMHDLHFLRDAVEGGDFCLSLALEKMPAHAGLVHLYDIDKREFVITCARGAGSEPLLSQRHPESDPVLAAAMRKNRAMVIADATSGDAAMLDRYRLLGGAKSLVVAPVILAGRFLGALELMNPMDGIPFTEDEGHALTYIGEQLAEFVATRGVLLDPSEKGGVFRR